MNDRLMALLAAAFALSIDWRLAVLFLFGAGLPGRLFPGVQAGSLNARDVADAVAGTLSLMMFIALIMVYIFLRRTLQMSGRGLHW